MAGPTVPVEQPKMPSADLINYRFDQIDQKLLETSVKLDKLTLSFQTKEDAHLLKEEVQAKISALQRQIDSDRSERRWKTRMIATAAYGALFVSIGTLIVYTVLRLKP